jgi:hypothetical protein
MTIAFDETRAAPVTDEEFSTAIRILSATSAPAMTLFMLAKNPKLMARAEMASRKLANAVKTVKRIRN